MANRSEEGNAVTAQGQSTNDSKQPWKAIWPPNEPVKLVVPQSPASGTGSAPIDRTITEGGEVWRFDDRGNLTQMLKESPNADGRNG